jgi:cytochrome P450
MAEQPHATERKYELYGPGFQARSYETFARMRRDDPVLCQPGFDGTTPIWFLTRYDDVAAVLLDDTRFVRDPSRALEPEQIAANPMPPVVGLVENHMLSKDGDEHRRLRRLVTKAFTPRMVERLRPRIEELANRLLDAVDADGRADLMEAYAFPLPIVVIAELLGIPTEDRDGFREWSEAAVMPAIADDEVARFVALMEEFVSYLRALFDRRRATPADDLVSAPVAAHEQDDALSEDELVGMTVLLIVAGHETTVGLIGNGILALLTYPEERARLESDPGLVAGAIEELLRFDSPVERALNRWAATDVELGRHTIRRGDLVIPSARRIGTASGSPTPTGSTSPAPAPGISPSAGEATTAWGRRSRGSRRRSPSRPSYGVCRGSAWTCPARSCRGGRPQASDGSPRSRSRGTRAPRGRADTAQTLRASSRPVARRLRRRRARGRRAPDRPSPQRRPCADRASRSGCTRRGAR